MIARSLQLVARERVTGVVRHRPEQLTLGPPLRHAHADARPACGGQELLVQLGVVGQHGDEDLAGHVRRRNVAVQLLEDAAHERGRRELLDLVDDEALAADDPALPHEEHLHRRLEGILGEPDAIEVLLFRPDHLLTLDDLAHRRDLVAQASGPLVLERVGRAVHLLVEPVEDGRVIAVEELEQVADQAVVVVAPDGPDAGRRALLDVRVEARAPEAVMAIELRLRARADRERPQ